MHPGRLSNVLVAASSLFAVIPLAVAINTAQWPLAALFAFTGAASVMQHLSDRKARRVPVFAVLSPFTTPLLWVDRALACAVAVWAVRTWVAIRMPVYPLASAIIGVAAMVASEHLPNISYAVYVVLHSAWHAHAFWACYAVAVHATLQ